MSHLLRCLGSARFKTLGFLIAAVALCAASSGCVQRRLMIRTNPPGALVYVDDYEVGITPVATDFVYYGTRKIRLVKDGFETLTVLQPIPAPWYEIPPLDFVSENVVPGEIRDVRVLDYQLVPQVMVMPEQVRDRAEQFRQSTRGGPIVSGPGLLAPQYTAPESIAPGTAPLPLLAPPPY